jgi:hypothetical protein
MSYPILNRWYHDQVYRYGDSDKTYQMAASFLDDGNDTEDWGSGGQWFAKFLNKSKYLPVDGSGPLKCTIADLREYKSGVDNILIRHVLEHNLDWRLILQNAITSFQKKLCIIIFTPMQNTEGIIDNNRGDLPDVGLPKKEFEEFLNGLDWNIETIKSKTKYGEETIYRIQK